MSSKERLDTALVQAGLIPSRDRAKRMIMAGVVFVDGQRVDKPGTRIPAGANLEVRGDDIPYVSRGGLKLEGALRAFDVDPDGLFFVDVGASTGGFTDCLLQNGARHVVAIDVGYGQLAWSLRNDARVTVMERTNIRYVKADELPQPADAATIDVAFISLQKVLPAVFPLLKPDGFVISLIKPQFEAGPQRVGKKGVVRDPDVHIDVIQAILDSVRQSGRTPAQLAASPVKGPEGNIEYLLLIESPTSKQPSVSYDKVVQMVKDAHAQLS